MATTPPVPATTPPPLPRPHGGVRGADLTRSSVLFGGPFGRMFRALPPAEYGINDAAAIEALTSLAKAMLAKAEDPFNGPDPEEGGIPAAFTYFGQFIDHDLTFDPASSLQKQNDIDALVDYRTPRFDLDNLYGRGPDDQPYLYRPDGIRFNLGLPMTGAAKNPRALDLPRSNPASTLATDKRAIIGDPRNDENVIVSQLQGLFLRFHNRLAQAYGDFESTQRAVRWHYQWVVLNDFLPTIVNPDVLNTVAPHIAAGTDIVRDPPTLKFYDPRDEAFLPLEFSAAAYRYGHSMVRPEYQLGDVAHPIPIFAGDKAVANLRGFREPPPGMAIDWRFFIDLEPLAYGDIANPHFPANNVRLQLAYKIDTSLVNPLGHLPEGIGPVVHALALRNLERGFRMRLPSGQAVARAMGVTPLTDAQIIIGKFTGSDPAIPADPADKKGPITDFGKIAGTSVFAGNCPLWTYILAETKETMMTVETLDGEKSIATRQLGEVGGRIVAETFVGLLLKDSSSYLAQHPLWQPHPDLMSGGKFGLRELIAAALADDQPLAKPPAGL